MGELLGVLQVGLVITQVEAGNDIIKWVFGFRGEDESVDAVDDLSEGEGGRVVAIED